MPDVQDLEDFLRRLDAGELDKSFYIELKKLSQEQLSELAEILLKRSADRNPVAVN